MIKKKNQRGQSLIEFILVSLIFFTVAFVNVQVSFGFAIANFFQYATFMASRAMLAGARTEKEQVDAGYATFEQLVRKNGKDRFGGFAKGSGEGDIPGATVGRGKFVQLANEGGEAARDWGWHQGATYKFKIKMYMMPLLGVSKRGKDNEVELESQSWLGRDPSDEECEKILKIKQTAFDGGQGPAFIYDNGC